MRYSSSEDRLNPIAPEGADESTLGGYTSVHGRAPAFEGHDGEPYTAAIEIQEPEQPADPWAAYLVFLRWARSGTAIMGHLDTDDLTTGSDADEARTALEAFPLTRVKALLEGAILRGQRGVEED
ncbi:MAG: hypothetical protein H0U67_01140 [Gemmatimonadetes bacterium]|nr:hypothetical protein [Gemmatimonadota bacterium]